MEQIPNRMSMGSRAGTSVKPKFGAGGNMPAPSRQGTAGKVLLLLLRVLTRWELEPLLMSKIDPSPQVEELMVLKVVHLQERFMIGTTTLQK